MVGEAVAHVRGSKGLKAAANPLRCGFSNSPITREGKANDTYSQTLRVDCFGRVSFWMHGRCSANGVGFVAAHNANFRNDGCYQGSGRQPTQRPLFGAIRESAPFIAYVGAGANQKAGQYFPINATVFEGTNENFFYQLIPLCAP